MKAGLQAGMKVLLAVICLTWLAGCGHRLPAPVEDRSTARSERQLSADGTYRIRAGDTLYAIAFSYGLDHRDVAKWNRIPRPYVIYPGQNLQLSPPVSGTSHSSGKSGGVQISGAKTPAETTTKRLAGNTPASTSAQPVPKTAPAPNLADPENWLWPTKGRLLRSYVAGDPARNGLDIAGREGQAITASAAGKVVYSGNGLIGYGELIIIKHSERMLSAYAHNRVRLVREGAQVTAAQKIAEMGRNDHNEQLLHFEIRARGKPVNPLRYLPKK